MDRYVEKKAKWKKFEELVTKIQKDLSPNAIVTPNDKIKGHITGRMRQVDVSIRQQVGQFNILIAIDCKDRSVPVDVKGVEEFIGIIQDIGANKGAIVSATGFTSTAIKRAESSGLNLYRLVDAEKHDWQTLALIPVLCNFAKLKSYSFNIKTTSPYLPSENPEKIMLFNENGKPINAIINLLIKKWNSGVLPDKPGEYKNVKICDIKAFIKVDDNFFQFEVTADVDVEQALYFGHLPLSEIKGFQDQVTREVITRGFTTEKLDIMEVEKNWKRLDSEKELGVKPLIYLKGIDQYPIKES